MFYRTLSPPGLLPHFLNIAMINNISGAKGTAVHKTLERPVLKPDSTDLKSERADLRSERADSRPERSASKPKGSWEA